MVFKTVIFLVQRSTWDTDFHYASLKNGIVLNEF